MAGHPVAYRFVVRRCLLIAATFLLAGAVLNVAVAWGFAAWVNVVADMSNKSAVVNGPGEVWGANVWQRAGAELCMSSRFARAGQTRTGLTEIPQQAAAKHPRDILPNLSGLTVPSESFLSGGTNHDHTGVASRGWPLLSMSCEYDLNPNRQAIPPCAQSPAGSVLTIRVISGIRTGAVDPAWIHGPDNRGLPRALPLRPIPVGFALNTLFYAAILWPLSYDPFVLLRRVIRKRRGLCPACGYPVGESDLCTECGKTLLGRAQVTT